MAVPRRQPIVCLVTDRRRLGEGARDGAGPVVTRLVAVIAAAADAGVDLVQIREPDLDDRQLLDLVGRAVAITRDTPATVLVNDRPDIALLAGAGGVHLKDDGMPAARVRALGPPEWLIGRSVHQLAAAQRADAEGVVDYLLLGTIFASASKPGRRPLGVDRLRVVAGAVSCPVLAIGGVGVAESAAVASSGAAGVAGIGLFQPGPGAPATDDIAARVRAVRVAFDKGRTLV